MPDTKSIPASAPPVVPTAENRLEEFLDNHFRKTVVAILLLLLVIAGFLASRHFAARRELEAAQMFSAATGVEDCDLVVQKYPGSVAAGNALLQKAELLWQQGKKASSIAALEEFLKTLPSHQLRSSAALALGTKQAALGEKDAARATFESFLKDHPKSELAPAADIQLGDMLWQEGKAAEAKKHFDSLLQKYPGNMAMFNQALEERQQLMGSGLPQKEVAGPPPPPAPKPAPVPPALQPPQITVPSLLPPGPALAQPPSAAPPSATTAPVQVPAPDPAPATAAPGVPAKPKP